MKKQEYYDRILAHFRQQMPEVTTELTYTTTFQLLVAVMLSAQCTDKRVNQVTPALFERFPDASQLASADFGEVPIGCVIVHEGKVIGRGYNRRTTDKSTLSHAEINAIRKATKVIGDWRLEDCTLYVTLEPCQMCSGAIVQARIPEVYIGCMNPKAGCAGSILNILQEPAFNHQVEVHK